MNIFLKLILLRILLVAVTTSLKFNEDVIYDFNYYAKVGGISNEELSELEISFIEEIGYSLFISEETYLRFLKAIQKNFLMIVKQDDIIESSGL